MKRRNTEIFFRIYPIKISSEVEMIKKNCKFKKEVSKIIEIYFFFRLKKLMKIKSAFTWLFFDLVIIYK